MVKLAPVTLTRDEINAKYDKMNKGRKLLFGIEKAAIVAPSLVIARSVARNENSNFRHHASNLVNAAASGGRRAANGLASVFGQRRILTGAREGFNRILAASSRTKALGVLGAITGLVLAHNIFESSKLKGRINQAKDDSLKLKSMFENSTYDVNKVK